MRLYFFPSLLPLAPIIPWLLTAVGAVAGGARFVRRSLSTRSRAAMLGLAVLSLAGAAGTAHWLRSRAPASEVGTRLTPREQLPAVTIHKSGEDAAGASADRSASGHLIGLWYRMFPRRALSDVMLAGDRLAVGTYDGTLDLYSMTDGSLVESVRKREPVLSGALLSDDRLWIGEGLHTAISSSLSALDASKGRVLWQREFLGHLEMPPKVDQATHRLWIGTGPRGLWCLDTRDGRVIWSKAIGHVDSTPLLADGKIWVPAQPDPARNESFLFALDAGSGKELWRASLRGQPWGVPSFSADHRAILVTSGVGQLGVDSPGDAGWSNAVSAADGAKLWSVDLGAMPLVRSIQVPEKGWIIHTLKSGELVALRAADGGIVWRRKLAARAQAAAILLPSRSPETEPELAVVTVDGTLSLRSALTGDERDRIQVEAGSTSSPAFIDGKLFVATPSSLTAFRLE